MTKKPRGKKYRNLNMRSGAIYYQRVWQGKRICFSLQTKDWDQAAGIRDDYEAERGIGRSGYVRVEVPTFAEFAKRYLKEDTSHLATTTRDDRERLLGKVYLDLEEPKGDPPRILRALGKLRVDAITAATLRDYWTKEVLGAGRGPDAGRNDVLAIAGVLSYGVDLELLRESPVDGFRRIMARKRRTQRGRAQSDPERRIQPIESLDQVAALVKAAKAEGPQAYLLVLLLLDAGLRLGEAIALRWGSIVWGADESDPQRALLISENRPRGGERGPTKSGRSRKVALSRRLRAELLGAFDRAFRPALHVEVVPGIEPGNFRNRDWRRILVRARIGDRKLKDLRDTFASQLLSAGAPLGYVSKQLGHADVAITARHYARWCGGDDYRAPVSLGPGELPCDVLAKGDHNRSHKSAASKASKMLRKSATPWRPRPGSNWRLPASEAGALSS